LVRPSRTYASVPRPKVTDVTNTDEWIVSAAVPNKPDAKVSSNVVDLASTAPPQPFCDPPIKATDPDAKHTFKETEQDVVMLPTDLNKNATVSVKQLCDYYTRLSKKNLTSTTNEPNDLREQAYLNFLLVLVASTAAYGFIVAPLPVSIPLLTCVTLGTILTSAAANTVNQLMEIPYDAQMKRTRNRVLVLGQMRYALSLYLRRSRRTDALPLVIDMRLVLPASP
jgi:hypothetical protein